jgi:cell division protein FtsB
VAFVVGALVVLWIVLVFARAVAASSAAHARADALRAQNVALEERYVSEQRELAVLQGDAFVKLQARAYGMGTAGERIFSLQAGAPSPKPIPLLGQATSDASPRAAPLDAWLTLLFGP